MDIKNKTELRKEIIAAMGNTSQLDYIEVYSDGVWQRMGSQESSNNSIWRESIASLSTFESGYTINAAITANLRRIEAKLNPNEKEEKFQEKLNTRLIELYNVEIKNIYDLDELIIYFDSNIEKIALELGKRYELAN